MASREMNRSSEFITRHIKAVAFATVSLIALVLCSLFSSGLTASRVLTDQYPIPIPETRICQSEERINNLLSLMTLDEKIECLDTNPSVPRLGVKGSQHVEGIHGLTQGGPGNWGRPKAHPTTTFPQGIGLGETWDSTCCGRLARSRRLRSTLRLSKSQVSAGRNCNQVAECRHRKRSSLGKD